MTLAVVTGASRGIGRAAALALAERGVDLVLVGRPSPERAESARQVAAFGVEAHALDVDLAVPEELEHAAARLLEWGVPDVLVNNAGLIERAPIEETSSASFDRQIAVNLRAPFVLSRAVLPAMRARGSGRIVHVGSISSTLGSAGAAAYCAAKWGLVGFMKSLAEEISGSGLSTVAILPGSVDTDMLVGSGFVPRMNALDVARSIVHYALDAPLAHNGGVVELFGT